MFDSRNNLLVANSTIDEANKPKIEATVGRLVLVAGVTKSEEDGSFQMTLVTDLIDHEKFQTADSLIDLMEKRYQECRYLCDRALALSAESLGMLFNNDRDVPSLQKLALEFEAVKNDARSQLV